MINKIIDAISIAINSCFGDDYEIYTESVEQGLQEPCFSIVCVNPNREQFLKDRYFRTNTFCIHYFPSSDTPKSECMDVYDRLLNALEYITIDGDKTRGTKMSGNITDGVLNFLVNYDMFTYKQQTEEESMQEIATNMKVENGKKE